MRLYGSLTNRIIEHSVSPTPFVGMGATVYGYSDRYAATVTAVNKTGKTIELTEDTVTKWDPWPSGYGTAFAPNPTGRKWVATLRTVKGGKVWRTKGVGDGVTLGTRAAYRDPHF